MSGILNTVPLFYYYIAFVVAFAFVLLFMKNKSVESKTKFLFVLCAINFIAFFVNDYYFYAAGWPVLTLLPFHLCNISVFLLPIALYVKNDVIFDFTFFVSAPGALGAMVSPSTYYVEDITSYGTLTFFIFHSLIVMIPYFMVLWGICRPVPTVKKAVRLSIFVFGLALCMHLLNIFLISTFNVPADYFFTVRSLSAPANFVFAFLARFVHIDLLYMLPVFMIMYLYMFLIWCIYKIRKT